MKRALQLLSRLPVLAAVVVVVAGLLLLSNVNRDGARAADPPPTPRALPTFYPGAPPVGTPWPTMSPDEVAAAVERSIRFYEEAKAKGQIVKASGPETAGIQVAVAGKTVQLPPDPYIAHYIDSVSVREGERNPSTPIIIIQRGNSRIAVSVQNGEVVGQAVSPGEERAFDFLEEALR